MPLIAGIDIGNATTEVALASDDAARRLLPARDRRDDGHERTRDNIAGTSPRWSRPGENTVVDERCLSHLS